MRIVVGSPVTPSNQPKAHWFFGGAIAISLLMHAVFGVALIDGVVRQLPETETEETPILVDLVPPPEPEAPELPALPEELPAQPEEPPPPPEEPPKTEEQVAEAPPNIPVLQRVIEFGETDSGPRIDLDGTSAQDPDEAEPDEPEQSESDTDESDTSETGTNEPETNEVVEKQDAETEPLEVVSDEALGTSKEQELVAQEAPASEAESGPEPEPDEIADAEAAPDDVGTDGQTTSLVTPKPRPARKRRAVARNRAGKSGGMTRATQLFSRDVLSDPRVRTAMKGMPRADRMNELCMTEMEGQLWALNPPRPPEFLPRFPQARGNLLQPRLAAFRSRGQWFNFTFRCEVDNAATKVMKFSYRIGKPIPRAEWAVRELPRF